MSIEIRAQIEALVIAMLNVGLVPTVALVSGTLCPNVGHNVLLGQLVQPDTIINVYCSRCIPPGIIYLGPDKLLEMNVGHLN